MFVKYPLRIYSMDENKFTKNKREKENIAIKLWIPTSVLDSSSVPRLLLPLARRLSFLLLLLSPWGKKPTSYSIGFLLFQIPNTPLLLCFHAATPRRRAMQALGRANDARRTSMQLKIHAGARKSCYSNFCSFFSDHVQNLNWPPYIHEKYTINCKIHIKTCLNFLILFSHQIPPHLGCCSSRAILNILDPL